MLAPPSLPAGAAEARLHLVADEDAAVLLDDLERRLEVAVGRVDESADALDRLRQESGDATLRRRLDQLLDVLRALEPAARVLEPERAPVAIGCVRVLHAGDLRRDDTELRVRG